MKHTVFHRLSALALSLIMLLPTFTNSIPAQAADQSKALYYWKITSSDPAEVRNQVTDNLRLDSSISKTHQVLDLTFRTQNGNENYLIYSLLNEGEAGYGLPYEGYTSRGKATESLKLSFNDLTNLSTKGMDAVNLKMTYALLNWGFPETPFYLVDNFHVQVTLDGKNWIDGHVPIRSWELLGDAQTSAGRNVYLFNIETENILDIDGLNSGDVIKGMRILPYGDYYYTMEKFRFHDFTVMGYSTVADFEAAVPAQKVMLDVNEQTLRDIVLERARTIANTPWISNSSIYTDHQGVGATKRTYKSWEGGVLYHGPIYCRVKKPGLELWRDCLENGVYKAGYTNGNAYGMDCMSFVYDAVALVSRSYSYIIWQTQSDPALRILGDLIVDESPTYTDKDILELNSEQAVYEAYALFEQSDLMTVYTAEGGALHIRIAEEKPVVVRNSDGTIDPDQSYVLAIEQGQNIRRYFRSPDGTITETTNSEEKHLAQFPNDKLLYSSNTLQKQKYTFRALRDAKYVPLTVRSYANEQIEDVQMQALFLPKEGDITKGLHAVAACNYHVAKMTVSVEDLDTGVTLYEDVELANDSLEGNPTHQRNYHWYYDNEALDALLAKLPNGNYRVNLSMLAGPVTKVGDDRPTTTRSYDFTVTGKTPSAQVTVSAPNSTAAAQKAEVTVSVSQACAAADVEIKYDADKLTFDSGSVTANAAVKLVKAGDGVVRILIAGADASAGELAKLSFTAKQSVSSDAFSVKSAMIATAEGANTVGADKAV